MLKDALHEAGLSGMTIIDVKGFGRQRGSTGQIDKSRLSMMNFMLKLKLK